MGDRERILTCSSDSNVCSVLMGLVAQNKVTAVKRLHCVTVTVRQPDHEEPCRKDPSQSHSLTVS